MDNDFINKSIIGLIQGDLPLDSHPFKKLAQNLGISEQEIIERIEELRQKGIIRRWGAVLRHQKAGYKANAMVAWKVEKEGADEAGKIMCAFREISHCYLREVPSTFKYNLFTMVHAHDDDELSLLIASVSEQTGLKDYTVIKSLRELKKASLEYV